MSKHKKHRNSERSWFRSGKTNRHHIVNKCRGGKATEQNLLNMDTERHKAWHFLFQNLSFSEVADLLVRCQEMKRS